MSIRAELTPQMLDYEQKFADSGEIRWLPYFMYFHPTDHRSPVVNTDASGFRYSERRGVKYSVADHNGIESVRLLAGSSTVFGIGASADRWTLSSRMSENDPRPEPWVNFAGRSFNSTQELLLLVLYHHLLPDVKEIVLFSGFNNLGLARQPSRRRLEHGAFFNCNTFFEALSDKYPNINHPAMRWFSKSKSEPKVDDSTPSMEEQMRFAADLTLRHLRIWHAVAESLGAKLTYILQPLSGWVRKKGSKEEEILFAELDKIGRFSDTYGDILQQGICMEYASLLQAGAAEMGVNFINISPILSESLRDDQWLFVDRIHFTDDGHDFVSKKILEVVQ